MSKLSAFERYYFQVILISIPYPFKVGREKGR
jgi:hypothetical protein